MADSSEQPLEMPVKRIYSPIKSDYTEVIATTTADFQRRYTEHRKAIPRGYTDAPYMGAAQFLGLLNETRCIYKINAPGYLYRRAYNPTKDTRRPVADSDVSEADDLVIFAASAPDKINSPTTRMLYMQATSKASLSADAVKTGGNNMFQLPVGSSTYMAFYGGGNENIELWFVPTMETQAYDIVDSEYVTKVGDFKTSGGSEVFKGDIRPGTEACRAIFQGDWKENFRIMFGRYFADEAKMSFLGTYQSLLKSERKGWMDTCGGTADVGPTKYGY